MPTMEDVTCIPKLFVAKICLCVCVCASVGRHACVYAHPGAWLSECVYDYWRSQVQKALCACVRGMCALEECQCMGPISLAKESPQPVSYKSDGTKYPGARSRSKSRRRSLRV